MWFERVSHSQCLLNLFWHCRFCVLICPPAPPSTEAAGWAALSAHSPLWAFFMPSHKSKGPGGEGLTWPCPQFPWIFSLRIWNGSSANSWKKSFEFKYSFYYCNPSLAAWSTLLQGVVAICPCCSCNWVDCRGGRGCRVLGCCAGGAGARCSSLMWRVQGGPSRIWSEHPRLCPAGSSCTLDWWQLYTRSHPFHPATLSTQYSGSPLAAHRPV